MLLPGAKFEKRAQLDDAPNARIHRENLDVEHAAAHSAALRLLRARLHFNIDADREPCTAQRAAARMSSRMLQDAARFGAATFEFAQRETRRGDDRGERRLRL